MQDLESTLRRIQYRKCLPRQFLRNLEAITRCLACGVLTILTA